LIEKHFPCAARWDVRIRILEHEGYNIMLLFEHSQATRTARTQIHKTLPSDSIPAHYLRHAPPKLPEVSELQVVRHFTQLSRKNFSIDTHFYPLGSCTMKYNPRAAHALASLEPFLARHPFTPAHLSQGVLQTLFELQTMLKEIAGMEAVSLAPMAGAQGEWVGVAMIKAYHAARQDHERTEMIVPEAAHGTNPASAVMCGFTIKEVPATAEGDVDLDALKKLIGPKTAGIMLTNPSTLGVFERDILEIASWVHEAGGLLYYDGANLNAILNKIRPGDMGFDVIHMNLHKTFATPHGGGGPGSGPVAVSSRLLPYLPKPLVVKDGNQYRFETENERPTSIGRLSTFMGNAGILMRAYIYIRLLGREGLTEVAEIATLNANYLSASLSKMGYTLAFPKRRASHEFVITMKKESKEYGVTALDVAKRLLDFGFHAPTVYFPLIVPECLLIEPTETEDKNTLDRFLDAMKSIREEMVKTPELLKSAPHTLAMQRLDDVKAVKELNVRWGE